MRRDAIDKPAPKTLVVPGSGPGRREVGHMLAAFAQAIMLRDARAVAALWEVPAIVVSDDGPRAVSSYEEVTMYFENTARKYDERGVSGARAEIQRVSWLTDRLVTVLVRWPYLAADGLDLGRAESCTYVLRRNDGDHLRVVAVIEMGPEPEVV